MPTGPSQEIGHWQRHGQEHKNKGLGRTLREACLSRTLREACLGRTLREACLGRTLREACLGRTLREACLDRGYGWDTGRDTDKNRNKGIVG